MRNIEVAVLNPDAVADAEKMAKAMASLTQRAEKIANMDDFLAMYNYKPETPEEIEKDAKRLPNLCNMPHPTLQKFAVINVVIVGASRRFLAQITRHQNEVKFMSGSLQYSNYGSDNNKTDFVVPYSYIDTPLEKEYLEGCQEAFNRYQKLIEMGEELGIDDKGDCAGYEMVQGLRNILVISATPYQWKHMIGQRICKRNTKETQYVLLKIWEQLYNLSPDMFGKLTWGCMGRGCEESKSMRKNCSGNNKNLKPYDLLKANFPKICT